MQEKLQALKKNDTCELVHLSAGKNIIGYKCVYTIKWTSEDKVKKYEVRLVANGYS
jgi:hypothetical protein